MNSTQDWFMMTGDLIINLRNTKTGDPFRFNKPPNELNLNCSKGLTRSLGLENVDNYMMNSSQPDVQKMDTNFEISSPGLTPEDQVFTNTLAGGEPIEDFPDTSNLENGLSNNNNISNEDKGDIMTEPNSLQQDKHMFATGTSSSSSGNSSGIVCDEELSNANSFSDNLNLASPSTSHINDIRIDEKYFSEGNCSFYDNCSQNKSRNVCDDENCYENIGEMRIYLNNPHDSNLYSLIEYSKSFDYIAVENENGNSTELENLNKNQSIDSASANRLAKHLYNLEGFQKSDVTRHISKNNEYSRTVAEEYLRLFDFTGQQLDKALRIFLSRFFLTGETQERERVLVYFSKRFHECNPSANFQNTDAIHTLTCALMLLNTDLHEENIQRKMTCSDFIMNLSGMNNGIDFPNELLKHLYYSIKQKPLGWNNDEVAIDSTKKDRKMFSKITTISKSIGSPYATMPRKFNNSLGLNPFIDVPNPTFAIEYKKGYVWRKCCYDPNGKKTPLGRRSWKLFYATLRDLVLYLHKDGNGFRKSQMHESFYNSIGIHHAIAFKASDYLKRKFVFRLITADYAEYLFETKDESELESWIDTLNTTAASLSAPALPMAVGSDIYKFQKELYPVSHTKLSLPDQLSDLEAKLLTLEKELEQLIDKFSKQNSTKKHYDKDSLEKENYLQHEVKRYRVYILCLKSKLQQQVEVEQLGDNNRTLSQQSCSSLAKSIATIYDS